MSVRKVVTKSSRKFKGYFPSKKLKRMVEYESLLERDAIYLFEFSPGIVSYQEQPELILYEHECRTRKYYPDFEVIFKTGKPLHVEVKPEQKLKCSKLADKFKAIHQRYQSHEANFLIFTDVLIRQNPLLSNLKTIAQVRNHPEDFDQIIVTAESLLRDNPNLSFNAFSQLIGYPQALLLLARHRVFCDLYQKLTSPSNFVRLPKETDHDTVYF
jgi:hypothetical protein